MTKPTDLAAFKAALNSLSDDDHGKSGVPLMDPINDALTDAGHETIKAADRDAFLEEMEGEPQAEPASADGALESGHVRIRIDNAKSNPIPLYVHGVGRYSLRWDADTTFDLPEDAVAALRDANIDLTIVKE